MVEGYRKEQARNNLKLLNIINIAVSGANSEQGQKFLEQLEIIAGYREPQPEPVDDKNFVVRLRNFFEMAGLGNKL